MFFPNKVNKVNLSLSNLSLSLTHFPIAVTKPMTKTTTRERQHLIGLRSQRVRAHDGGAKAGTKCEGGQILNHREKSRMPFVL